MFTSEMKERAAGTVELRGVSATGLEKVLQFIYSGNIVLSLDNIQDILAAASHLQVMPVLDFCKVSDFYCIVNVRVFYNLTSPVCVIFPLVNNDYFLV